MFRRSARARNTASFLSRRGGIYPSTILRIVPLPSLAGEELNMRISSASAAAEPLSNIPLA